MVSIAKASIAKLEQRAPARRVQQRDHSLAPREAAAPLAPPNNERGGAARATAVGERELKGANPHQTPPGREREHRALQWPPPPPLCGERGEPRRGARRERRPRAQRAPHAAAAAAAVHAPDGTVAEHGSAPG
eukprot:scaffold21354_cov48-Phaeocystis_antarctica.AAC.1